MCDRDFTGGIFFGDVVRENIPTCLVSVLVGTKRVSMYRNVDRSFGWNRDNLRIRGNLTRDTPLLVEYTLCNGIQVTINRSLVYQWTLFEHYTDGNFTILVVDTIICHNAIGGNGSRLFRFIVCTFGSKFVLNEIGRRSFFLELSRCRNELALCPLDYRVLVLVSSVKDVNLREFGYMADKGSKLFHYVLSDYALDNYKLKSLADKNLWWFLSLNTDPIPWRVGMRGDSFKHLRKKDVDDSLNTPPPKNLKKKKNPPQAPPPPPLPEAPKEGGEGGNTGGSPGKSNMSLKPGSHVLDWYDARIPLVFWTYLKELGETIDTFPIKIDISSNGDNFSAEYHYADGDVIKTGIMSGKLSSLGIETKTGSGRFKRAIQRFMSSDLARV